MTHDQIIALGFAEIDHYAHGDTESQWVTTTYKKGFLSVDLDWPQKVFMRAGNARNRLAATSLSVTIDGDESYSADTTELAMLDAILNKKPAHGGEQEADKASTTTGVSGASPLPPSIGRAMSGHTSCTCHTGQGCACSTKVIASEYGEPCHDMGVQPNPKPKVVGVIGHLPITEVTFELGRVMNDRVVMVEHKSKYHK